MKRFIAIVLYVALLIMIVPPVSASESEDNSISTQIKTLLDLGLLEKYEPNADVTRETMKKSLNNLYSNETYLKYFENRDMEKPVLYGQVIMVLVDLTGWAPLVEHEGKDKYDPAQYFNVAVRAGITRTKAGEFDDPITVEEYAKLLYAALCDADLLKINFFSGNTPGYTVEKRERLINSVLNLSYREGVLTGVGKTSLDSRNDEHGKDEAAIDTEWYTLAVQGDSSRYVGMKVRAFVDEDEKIIKSIVADTRDNNIQTVIKENITVNGLCLNKAPVVLMKITVIDFEIYREKFWKYGVIGIYNAINNIVNSDEIVNLYGGVIYPLRQSVGVMEFIMFSEDKDFADILCKYNKFKNHIIEECFELLDLSVQIDILGIKENIEMFVNKENIENKIEVQKKMIIGNYKSAQYYDNISSMLSKNMYNARNALDSVFAEIIHSEIGLSKNISEIEKYDDEKFAAETVPVAEKVLNNMLENSDFIKSAYLYCIDKEYVISSSKIYKSAQRDEFTDISWFDAFYGGDSEIFLRSYSNDDAVFRNCISVCRKMYDTDIGEILVVYNIKYDKLNFIKNMDKFNNYEINIINNDKSIIYSTNVDKVSHSVDEDKTQDKMYCMSEGNDDVKTYISKNSLLESIRTRNIKTTIVAEIQKNDLPDSKTNFWYIIIIAAVCVGILLLVSIFTAIKFYSTIAEFFYKLSPEPEKGETVAGNEINDMESRLYDIIENKSRAESKLAESIMQLQRSQSIALQSQISPHFLFNTLQLINSIAFIEIGHDSQITEAVGILCDILREAMDTTEYTSTFEDELRLAEKYVKIQNMKYEDAFAVSYDIDMKTMGMKVVKLSLQPILENSMHHGYADGKGKLNIVIHSHIVNDKLIIEVEDDGIGMTEDRLAEVIRNLENKQIEKKNSIGLLNLNQRIKLIFGYEYGCTIRNNGAGVTVTVSYPIIR